jgi:hypothetical protein
MFDDMGISKVIGSMVVGGCNLFGVFTGILFMKLGIGYRPALIGGQFLMGVLLMLIGIM